jgi:hypothetical protein
MLPLMLSLFLSFYHCCILQWIARSVKDGKKHENKDKNILVPRLKETRCERAAEEQGQ